MATERENHSTHVHSAWATAADVSSSSEAITEARRSYRLPSVTRFALRTIFDPCPLDGVAGGCFGSREFAIPDSPLAIQTYQTDCPRVPLHHDLNLN